MAWCPEILDQGIIKGILTIIKSLSKIKKAQLYSYVTSMAYNFALDVYKKCSKENTNVIISPLSVSIALATMLAGAKHDTAREIKKVLDLKSLNFILKPPSSAIKLRIANRIYSDKINVRSEFKDVVGKCYRTSMERVNSEEIRKFIQPGTGGLVMVNSISFKGDWKYEFKPEYTLPAEFIVNADKKVTVEMMYKADDFGYFEDSSCQILELPYRNEYYKPGLKMFIILPKHPNFEKNLSADTITSLLESLKKETVKVFLPKFKLKNSIHLSNALSAMGIEQLFREDIADLSGITNNEKKMFLSEVIHEASVEVNEEGGEPIYAMWIIRDVFPKFYADHPFLFFIRDDETKCILFFGRVINPVVQH